MAHPDGELPGLAKLTPEGLAEHGLNVSALAREMLSPSATKSQVNGRRRLIQKWSGGKNQPNALNAIWLARRLGGDPGDYRREPVTQADWRADIASSLREVIELAQRIDRDLRELQHERSEGLVGGVEIVKELRSVADRVRALETRGRSRGRPTAGNGGGG